MSWKQIGAIAVIVLIGVAYLAGYIPEQRARAAAEARAQAAEARAAALEGRVRLGQLLGEVLALKEVVARQNYGQAQELSSAFFDRVRSAEAQPGEPAFAAVLTDVAGRRDAITAALAKADPAAIETLQAIEDRLRDALGYPRPTAAR
jgi:hypothetical protein